jgi:hypothetical protein
MGQLPSLAMLLEARPALALVEGGAYQDAYGIYWADTGTGLVTHTGIRKDTDHKAPALGGLLHYSYTPGTTHYIQAASGAGTKDFPEQLTAGNIKKDVVSGTVTGTLAAGGGPLVGSGGLVL